MNRPFGSVWRDRREWRDDEVVMVIAPRRHADGGGRWLVCALRPSVHATPIIRLMVDTNWERLDETGTDTPLR